MKQLRYRYEDRFAETQGYDGFQADKEELVNFYETKVRPKFDNSHDVLKRDQDDQIVHHLCYDCNMQLWREVYNRVKNIAEKSGVYVNWEQVKHVIKFTFLGQPPGGFFMPHVNYNLLALSAFNIPLKGKTEIALFQDNETEITRHEYVNPCFLNVNRPHAVFNDEPTERIILKTHMTVVPWHKLVENYETGTRFQLFEEPVPWEAATRKW